MLAAGAVLVSLSGRAEAPVGVEAGAAWSCGAAALLSVAQRVEPGAAARLSEKLQASPELLQGARSMLDLAEAARAVGIPAAGVRVAAGEWGECPTPCIAHLKDGHFVALLARRGDEVEILDDGVQRRLSGARFGEVFSGAALVLGEGAGDKRLLIGDPR